MPVQMCWYYKNQSHRSRQEGRKGLKSVTAVVPKIAKQCAANAFKQKYCADPGAIYMEATAGQTNKWNQDD